MTSSERASGRAWGGGGVQMVGGKMVGVKIAVEVEKGVTRLEEEPNDYIVQGKRTEFF